jgi:hypothetical protein
MNISSVNMEQFPLPRGQGDVKRLSKRGFDFISLLHPLNPPTRGTWRVWGDFVN